MNTPLDFQELNAKCIKYLNDRKFISVATAYQNQVRARVVDYCNQGIQVGFITWENTIKMDHLKKNPNISLCVDALQVEGTAKIIGHPALPENKGFMEIYEKRHPSPHKNFISQKNVTLIMVEPTLLIQMQYETGHLFLDHLNINQQSAYRKELSPWTRS
jgi:hypothetical protein